MLGRKQKKASPSPSSNVQARRRALPELIGREAIGADTPWCITRKTGVESAELPVVEPPRARPRECYPPRPFGVLCTNWCLIILICTHEEESMSLDFYDSNGRPYAYSDDGETISTFSGTPIAYIDGDAIYSFRGNYIGCFDSGLIRDTRGDALLFTSTASGGPMKPMKMMKPMKSMKQMKPMKGMKQMRPMRAMNSMGWSQQTPEKIFGV